MFRKLYSWYYQVFKESYYIQVVQLSGNEVIDERFVAYESLHGKTKFTKDPCEALCTDYLLGAKIAKRIAKELKGQPMQVNLITQSDIAFIGGVTGKYNQNQETVY